MSTLPRPLLF